MAFTGAGHKSTPLHKAARRGNEEEVVRLLRQGADVTARDAEGRTPLHLAVMRGHLGIIERLLEHGGPAVLLSRDILSCTPVHLAAVQNQVRLIKKLIKALVEDERGCTPLHVVARRPCMQDFMGFLHLGWDLASCDIRNEEAIQLTEDATKPAIQQILGWTSLHLAAMDGNVSHIEKLVRSFRWDVHVQSANSWSPLHYAAAYNQVGSIEALVRLGGKVDVRDSVGSTPLHVACGEGHMAAVLKLIALGCDPAVKDRDGCTPLYCAAAWNRIDVVRQLHKLGCPSWVQSEEGRMAVHVAAEQGWVELIEVLVKELGSSVDSRDTYKFTPLHSAGNWGWVEAIQKLVELKHEVDVKDYLGRTPLHYAALHGRCAAIRELVKLGASLQERDSRGGYTPLHLAADAGQCEAVVTLIQLGADTEARTAKGWTCLQLATMKGPANVDVLGLLVEMGADVKAVTDNKNLETPLHIAARAGRLDIVQKLIKCGVTVTARTKDGSTPLHYAAAFGQSHVLEELVKAGCDIHLRDNAQNTPLHLASGCGFLEAVMKLVELGGDLNSRDMSECTPLQNTAHGTYSALAQVPPAVTSGQNCQLQGLGSLSLRRLGLSSAMLPKGASKDEGSAAGGMVPVRTGFAWATLGDVEGSTSTSSQTTYNWRGAELMSLLRKATRCRRGGSLLFGSEMLLDCKDSSNEDSKDEEEWDKWSHRDLEREREGLEFLLKKTEALQLSHMDQDRSRLIPVAEKIVELGADIAATDNEGRTALHLAAGCGDKAMVMKLVELGADINCRDSVGGTPMHHAAMANKKEMMFSLARLGCDWRTRAEGIDGATAAFVLCGQHGKTSRQQKLLEAKLKRVYMEGENARKMGKNPFEVASMKDDEPEEDYEELAERADANMAALLEEEAAQAAAAKQKRKKNKKKNKNVEKDKAVAGGLQEDVVSENADKKGVGGKGTNERVKARNSEDRPGSTAGPGGNESGQDEPETAARVCLEEAVVCANTVLEIGTATGADAMLEVRTRLDDAIERASSLGVSAKYAKKVRRRLQTLIEQDVSNSMASSSVEPGDPSQDPQDAPDDEEGWVTAHTGRNRQASTSNHSSHNDSGYHHHHSSNHDTEWHQVGASHSRKHNGGGFGGKSNSRSAGRHTPQGMPRRPASSSRSSESRIIRSPVVGAGNVVVRTGNVVVVKAAPVSSAPSASQAQAQPPPPQPPPQKPVVHSPLPVPPGPKPAWNQGMRTGRSYSGAVVCDPDFPPLQSSASASTGGSAGGLPQNGHKVGPPGLAQSHSEPVPDKVEKPVVANTIPVPNSGRVASPSAHSFLPAAQSPVGTPSEPWLQQEGLKSYELFGDRGRLAGPVGLSSGAPLTQTSSWAVKPPIAPFTNQPAVLNGHGPVPGDVSVGVQVPNGSAKLGQHYAEMPPMGFQPPFPGQMPNVVQTPFAHPPNGMMAPGMSQGYGPSGEVWQVPAPFRPPIPTYMPTMSSVGPQVVNVNGGMGPPPFVQPPGHSASGIMASGRNYDPMMQARYQPPPPPPPGRPPYMDASQGQLGGSYEPSGFMPAPSPSSEIAKKLPEQIPGQADVEVECHTPPAPLERSCEDLGESGEWKVTRHLLGELEAEIGF